MLTSELKTKVDALWDKFWSGGISNPLNAIEQITYLLFIKQLDENDIIRKRQAAFIGQKYKSPFDGIYFPPGTDKKNPKNGIDKNELRWSKVNHGPVDEIYRKMQTLVFPFIKELGDTDSYFAKHMQNAVFLIPKASMLHEAMKTIDEIYASIAKEDRFIDTQGDVYEYLLNQLSQAGKNGQFRTPPHIIELVVELVDPKLGDRIADPACGSAGFLLAALKYIISSHTSKLQMDDNGFMRGSMADKLVSDAAKNQLQQDTFYGFDIDPTMIRLGLMNLMMHGIANPKIDYKDTLSKFYEEENHYHVVMANPPFTGSLDKSEIHKGFTINTTKTELLFLERIYKMLRPGGTAGVIIPQGVLFGGATAFKDLRKLLIKNCELKAVISMPSGVFKPYAGVATAILIFTKAGETKNVWFYEMKSDGRSLDDKRTALYHNDGSRDFGDIHQIVDSYNKRNPKKETDRTKQHFFVNRKEIEENNYDLSISKYKQEIYNDVHYEKPEVILEKLIGKDGKSGLEYEIIEGLNELKAMLK